jgi:hypothetical protein
MNDLFSFISCIGVVIYFLSKHREDLGKLNKIQKIGVFISYTMTIIISGICIHYGGSILTERFQNGFLIFIIQILVVIVTLWVAISLLNRVLQKITNGIFSKIT